MLTMGFGLLSVSSPKREPRPPANSTAFTIAAPSILKLCLGTSRLPLALSSAGIVNPALDEGALPATSRKLPNEKSRALGTIWEIMSVASLRGVVARQISVV